jgi:TP901 family phage tail tape measure protein
MAVQLGFGVAPDAQSAAAQFVALLDGQQNSIEKLSDAISRFNQKGDLVSQTFKAVVQGGSEVEVVLRETGKGFELLSGKVDDAVSSLKRMKEAEAALAAQQKADLEAMRRRDANSAEGALGGLKGSTNNLNVNQVNAAEAAIQRIRAAIESGAVSLQRFQQLYAQVTSNPKAIIPNLTAEEASVVRSLRTMQEGFDVTGDKAKRMGEKFSISMAGIVRLFEAQVIKRLTGGLQSSLAEGVQSSVDFSVRIAEIGTITQQSGVSLSQWSEGVRRLSEQFGNTQADVAEAAYQALSNQVTKAADTFQFLETALRFSKATVTSAADSVNLLSSAMKSFNIPTSDAEKVASIFFKTIELGRVRGNEMADTFGRVGTIAADAGVKLEEVAAATTTLTVKGMKFSDASTLISNTLLKLIRPTEEMKELFAEWGVASGQAAIATFGFGGVLQKLDVEAQKGSSRLGELFNQMRAFRGITNLTGNSFGDFQKDFAEITQGQGEFNNAVDTVMKSFGDRVKRQLNEVKVYFSEDFGDSIIQSTVKWSEAFGGAVNIIKTFEKVLTPIVIGLVGWKAGTLAASVATYAWNTAMASTTTTAATTATAVGALSATTTANTTAVVANATANLRAEIAQNSMSSSARVAQTAMSALTFTMQNLNVFLGGFGVGVSLGMLLFNGDDQRRIENIRKDLEKIANLQFKKNFAEDKTTSNFRDEVEATRAAYDARFKIVLQYNRNNVLEADAAKKKAVENLKEVTERSKVSSKTYFDAISQGMKKLSEAAAEAKQMIESSLKSSEGVQRKLTDNIFGERLKFASEGRVDSFSGMVVDEQKTGLIKQRINELTELARSKFKEGTKESVDDARKLYDEVEKLTSNLFDAQTKKRRTEFDEMVKRGMATPSGFDVDPQTGAIKERYVFTVRTAELEQKLKQIATEKLQAETQLRAEKEKQLTIIQDQELREKERVKAIHQAIDELIKLKAVDDKGGLTGQLKNSKDPKKDILGEFDRQAEIANKNASQLELRDRLQTLDFIAKQRKALEAEVDAAVLADRVKTEQETSQMTAKSVQDRITKTNEQFSEANSRIQVEARALSVKLKLIAEEDGPSWSRFLNPIDNTGKMRAELVRLEEAAVKANEAFSKSQTAENLKRDLEAIDAVVKKYNELIKLRGLDATSPEAKRVSELQRGRNALADSAEERNTAQKALRDAEAAGDKFGASIRDLPNAFLLLDQASETSKAAVVSNFEQIMQKADSLILKAREAEAAIAAIGGGIDPNFVGPPAPAAPRMFGGQVSYFANGGYVDWKARGSDMVPAMLAKPETVMTGEASGNWSPLLRAMNAGLKPSQAFGGNNTTNIGDININMQADAPAGQNVRAFAKVLRRQLRRGTASLQ